MDWSLLFAISGSISIVLTIAAAVMQKAQD
jgi:hypothetical protein